MLGKTLGHYRIIEKLGAGGMGVVYRAHDERLDRDVALKILPLGVLADQTAHARFRKEALTLARLDHPNIAQIYDFDTRDGVDYLVMEYLPGTTLAQRVSQGSMPEREVALAGVQVAAALEEAHEHGIIHRDLKPGNIMVTPKGQAKVLDFGLAKKVPPVNDETGVETFSDAGEIAGTLPYMAPEQVCGEPIDARADVYTLGTVLYELATGKRAFPGTQVPRLLRHIQHCMPVSPCTLNPALSAEFERIVLKTLEKDPRLRYQSARELREDLERLVSPMVVETPTWPPSAPWNLILRAARAHPRRAGLLLVPLAAVLVAVFWFASRQPPLPSSARDWILLANFENQTGEPLFDNSLLTALTVSLGQSTRVNIFPRALINDTLRRMGQPATAKVNEEIGREICQREGIRALLIPGIARSGREYVVSARLVNPLTGVAVRSYLESARDQDHVLDALGDIAAHLRHDLGESLDSIQKGGRPLAKVTTSSLQALKYFTDGQGAWNKGEYEQAVELLQNAVRLDPDFAEAHAALGNAYYSFINNDPVDGRKEYEKALKLADRTTERERMAIQAMYAGAQKHTRDAVRLFTVYLKRWPDDWEMRYDLANTLHNAGFERQAILQYKKVLQIAPADARPLINLATTYGALGDYAQALQSYEQAFRLEPAWVTAGTLNHEYGFALVHAGKEETARRIFAQAMDKPNMRGRAERSLAWLALYHGHYHEAKGRLEGALLADRANKWRLSEAREHVLLSIVAKGEGNRARRVSELDAAARIVPGLLDKVWMGSLVGTEYARCGLVQKAERLLQWIRPVADEGNVQQSSQLHLLEGEIALARKHAPQAIELFSLADEEMHSPMAHEGLARSYRAAGNLDRTIAAYEQLVGLANPPLGWEPQQDWIAAHYCLAQAYRAKGNASKEEAALSPLLILWKDADPGLPLLRKARLLNAELHAVRQRD